MLPGVIERALTPVNEYLFAKVRAYLSPYLPDDNDYEKAFDVFEYLLNLIYLDLVKDQRSPGGRFAWKYSHRVGIQLDELLTQLGANSESSPMLQAGLFEGDVVRVQTSAATLAELLKRRVWTQGY
jgi:hypothetical protein